MNTLITLGVLALLVGALVALAIRRSRRRDAALRALANEPVSPPLIGWQITGFSSGSPARREWSASQPRAYAAPAVSTHGDDTATNMLLMDTGSSWGDSSDSNDCGGSDSGGDSSCGGGD